MSIQSEIDRIAGAKSDIADAIEDQGVTVPSGTKLDGMANLIGQISGGSGKLNSTQAADAYDPTATYAVGDKVSYAGNVYSCISAISTPEAWDSTHWDQVDPIQDQVDDVRNTLNSEIATRQTYVRPNLLDNWYFVGGGSQQGGGQFPINQRGLSIYSNGGYTIDRWNAYEGTTITTESDGLLIESNQSSSWKFGQRYESGFLERIKGKEVTFSILFKGQTTGYIAANIFTNEGNHLGNYETTTSGIAKVTYALPNNITDFRCVIYGNDAFHAKIVAMKLELGSTQTLAHQENGQWVLNEIPNYQQELAKCQRYYWNPMIGMEQPEYQWWFPAATDNNENMLAINITYPVTMARVPDIVLLSNTLRNQNNGENIRITSMSYNRTNSVFSNVFSMVLSKNLTAGKYYGFQFALSADL